VDKKQGPDIRLFGTIMVSFPAALLPVLTNVNEELKAIRFTINNADEIKQMMPNRKLVVSEELPKPPCATYRFTIERFALANWLLDQQKQKPDLNFYNIDIIKYELETAGIASAPLLVNSYWKLLSDESGIRIDYKLQPTIVTQNGIDAIP